jgi:hypothetical protein
MSSILKVIAECSQFNYILMLTNLNRGDLRAFIALSSGKY